MNATGYLCCEFFTTPALSLRRKEVIHLTTNCKEQKEVFLFFWCRVQCAFKIWLLFGWYGRIDEYITKVWYVIKVMNTITIIVFNIIRVKVMPGLNYKVEILSEKKVEKEISSIFRDGDFGSEKDNQQNASGSLTLFKNSGGSVPDSSVVPDK